MPIQSSQVNPGALRNDYSGFAEAGRIKGQMYANLGQNIKEGYKAHKEKIRSKAEEETAIKILTDIEKRMGGKRTPEEIKSIYKNGGMDAKTIIATGTKAQEMSQMQKQLQQQADQREAAARQQVFDNKMTRRKLRLEREKADDTRKYQLGILGVQQSNADNPKPSEADAKIDRILYNNPSISRQDAQAIVDGTKVLNTDPITGEITVVDKLTNTSSPITPIDQPQAPAAAAPERTLWDRIGSTGAINAGLDKVQRASGQFGINIADPEVQKDIKAFDLASKGLIQILALNKRYTVSEMNEIKKKITVSANAWTDEQSLQSNLEALDEWARKEMKKAIADADNRRLDSPTRQQAEADKIGFQNYLGELGVPQEGGATSSGIKFLGFE
jgi:hypothetical protein